ncbi:nuclear transport factor 2 family protein [Arcicella sp. LKC2W]|uniref:nuclear transport factor 2 family protein n=1 Tax=Arcicella sp. LKC2W TaxID=2984198 RepID=UPI002B2103C5|nr:nuclear transport factor 2 family protein [Arcicella sp. LKC2W]MEA5461922.1 nuclear transport factor 2 family protein [Arcicella sp. LKC2W]
MKKILIILALFLGNIFFTQAQTAEEKKVTEAVEFLKKAMIDGDKVSLEKIAHQDLIYGHSNGNMETKTMFVEAISSGKSDFKTIDLTEQTVKIHGKTAIVRHKLFAETNNGGVAGTVKLGVLLVFQKTKGQWILLARQAFKI